MKPPLPPLVTRKPFDGSRSPSKSVGAVAQPGPPPSVMLISSSLEPSLLYSVLRWTWIEQTKAFSETTGGTITTGIGDVENTAKLKPTLPWQGSFDTWVSTMATFWTPSAAVATALPATPTRFWSSVPDRTASRGERAEVHEARNIKQQMMVFMRGPLPSRPQFRSMHLKRRCRVQGPDSQRLVFLL